MAFKWLTNPSRQEFRSPKSRPSIEQQPNIYKIPCADCGWYYKGETCRCLEPVIRNILEM